MGTKKSGKTKTIEYLISGLSREGFKIGSIKHIHHPNFSIDREGADTWRHMHAGALITVALSPNQTVILKKSSIPDNIEQIIKVLGSEELDFVFIEGFHSFCSNRPDIQKIVIAKDLEDLRKTLSGTKHPILAITGLVAKNKDKIPKEMNIPAIDLDCEGHILIENLIRIFRDSIRDKEKKNGVL
ncbi:MAG: molybdopterin-guanine dinucleotide biosynthesis protein B [Candidatus Bathyarchaeia archaeon]